MPKKKGITKKNSKPDQESKLFSFIAVFLTIIPVIGAIGFIIAIIFKRKDRFVMYHTKQAIALFILSVLVILISTISNQIYYIGGIITGLLWIFFIVLWVIAWINTIQGKRKPFPLFGVYGEKIDL